MFGLGGGELFVVALLAILLIGPKELPKVATQVGRWYRQLKTGANEIKSTVEKEINLDEDPPHNSKKSE